MTSLSIRLSPSNARVLRALLATVGSGPGTPARFAVEETLDALDSALGPGSAPPLTLWRAGDASESHGRAFASVLIAP